MPIPSILLVLCLAPAVLLAQPGIAPLPQLDSLIQTRMKEHKIVGLSVGLVKNGKLYYSKGYGYTDVDSVQPVGADTRFAIASVTKLFTITAVMQLVEQGKLDLSKHLVDYIPDYRMRDSRYKDITLFQLITHSSGLPWDNSLDHSPDDSTALRLFIYSLKNSKLRFKPGSRFGRETYSNTGYDVLGYLVERCSGMTFERYLDKNIFQPTGMRYTGFDRWQIPAGQLAMPLKIKGNSRKIRRYNSTADIPPDAYPSLTVENYPNYAWGKREHNPDGYLFSCASDLCLWMIHLLDLHKQTGEAPGVLKKSTLDDMWTPRLKVADRPFSIGLGWWHKQTPAGDFVFHVGNDPGYSAILLLYPEQDLGIVILSNARYAQRQIWNSLPDEIYQFMTAADGH